MRQVTQAQYHSALADLLVRVSTCAEGHDRQRYGYNTAETAFRRKLAAETPGGGIAATPLVRVQTARTTACIFRMARALILIEQRDISMQRW